ncbi:Peroxidase [Heracleum sosnowskyi]|uniref:Peroxidase n=1 Tax=Heracleum sosnowskyi TaxID=360622 RepID=A0AAD8GQV3_9APIA|nr:Peroxidase [Heracleum sosnowskyi]
MTGFSVQVNASKKMALLLLFVSLLALHVFLCTSQSQSNPHSKNAAFQVGVLLDLDSPTGGIGLSYLKMALSDFYALHSNYTTRLALHVEDPKGRVIDSAALAVRKDPTIPAAIIRLYFHDCFVRGCDASVLLKTTSSKNPSEQDSVANKGLRGLDVIEKVKAKVEAECPGTVSCADILAFATRDSTYKAGGIYYNITSGRRDGTVSLESEVTQFLPPPFLDVPPMLQFFTNKSMSVIEMTALSGAHSIGLSQCSTFSVDLDDVTPYRLDNQYHRNLKRNMGVLTSDQVLASSPLTADIMKKYIDNPEVWVKDFAEAMVHLGNLDVLTGTKGEIRNKCGTVN